MKKKKSILLVLSAVSLVCFATIHKCSINTTTETDLIKSKVVEKIEPEQTNK